MVTKLRLVPTINEQLEPIELRPSLLESMSLCPARQSFKEHPDFDDSPSEAMSWGTLMHALVEPTLKGEGVKDYTTKDVLEIWIANAKEHDDFDIEGAADPLTLRTLAMEARDAYVEWSKTVWQILKPYHIVAVEERLRSFVGVLRSGRAVYLSGTPDVVRVGELDDWKTSKRHWDQGKADSRAQGVYYAWLAGIRYEVPIDRMHYWSYNRTKGDWQVVTQEISQDNIDAALANAMEYAGMVEAGYYPATPSAPTGKNGRGWWCSAAYCEAWDVCHLKGIIADGVDLTEKRQKGWQ